MPFGIRVALAQAATLLTLGVVWGAAVALADLDLWFGVALALVFVSPVVLALSYALALRRFWNADAGPAAPIWVRSAAGVSQGLTLVSLFATGLLALAVAYAIATWPSDM